MRIERAGSIGRSEPVKRRPVTSSNLASVGYDDAGQTLEIEFLNGSIYQYFGVPSAVHSALLGAESVGSYFSRNIKNNYRYSRL